MRIICPACGVNMALPDDEHGGIVECAGCGKRIRFGTPTVVRGEDDIDLDVAAGAVSTSPTIRKSSKPPVDWRKGIFAGLVGAMATAMLVVLVFVAHRVMVPGVMVPAPAESTAAVPWDRDHRADLLKLKATAESQAMAGNWQKSYDAYQQILTLVGDHEVKDPVALTAIESVRPGQDRAMAAMLAGRASITPAVPVASAHVELKPATMPVVIAVAQPSASSRPVVLQTQPVVVIEQSATTQATTMPVARLDPAQAGADTAPPLAGPPPPAPSLHAYTLPDAVTDAEIGEAIDKGVKFLAGQFRNGEVVSELAGSLGFNKSIVPKKPRPQPRPPKGTPPGDPSSDLDHASDLGNLPPPEAPLPPGQGLPGGGRFVAPWTNAMSTPGVDALCVYALLNAGRAQDVRGLGEKDPFTDQILDQLKRYDMPFTYHRSLRAAALAVFNRTVDNAALEEDVRWLQAASMKGGYTYTMPTYTLAMPTNEWDNSNSQYGLLGVWSGAQAGISIANSYWTDVEQHWLGCENHGTWGYTVGHGSSLTMTCAGIASLLVARDYLDDNDNFGANANQPSSLPAIDAGLNWLDSGDNCMSQLPVAGAGGPGYGLYGLERVGLASGFKYFGKHDWYSELARRLVAEQHFDGSWGGGDGLQAGASQRLIDTAYALLFLARGRHPILFNKLRYDGDWNNRPHDAAHLSRFAGRVLERPLNWQVVNLRRNWFDWMDCPVLYIAGDKAPKFSEADYKAIRDFADGGGLIFTHADGGSPEFTKWVAATVRKIFPKYELMQVPRGHPLYSVVYQMKNPAPLLAVSNGSRLLLVHSPTDLSGGWQLNWSDEKKPAFQMGVNLFVYAAGKANLKNRLASSYIPMDPAPADSTRQIARLQYAGEWDPEPYAWTRFSRYFQWETHQAIDPVTVEMKSLTPGSFPMAVLTGTVRHDFTDAENAAASAFVQAGGLLVIDACGGQSDFAKCVEATLLPNAFPGSTPMPIAPTHPLLIASRPCANDLTHPMLRGYANENGGKNLPIETFAYGKGWVIYSRLDLTTGLLGTQSWGILGFDPAYAQALMKNAVLWAEARSPVAAK